MKKLVLVLCFLLMAGNVYAKAITIDTYVSADDITLESLNSNFNTLVNNLNSIPGDNLIASSVSADALSQNANPEKRWADTFANFVVTGLLAPTDASLTSTTTAGRALIANTTNVEMKYVQKDATQKTYTAGTHTYVDLNAAGTYTYSEVSQGASEPAVTSNSIRLFKVSADSTSGVGEVTDLRVIGASLGANEDFYIAGMEMTAVSPDNMVTIDTGVVYHGSRRLEKTAQTGLRLGAASDWWDGTADTLSAAFAYVGVDSSGSIKFLGAAPNKADTDENTDGILRYWDDGSKLWRVLGATYVNTSNLIAFPQYQVGNYVQYDTHINVTDPTKSETVILDEGTSTSFADVTATFLPAFTSIYPDLFNFSDVNNNVFEIYVRRNGSLAGGRLIHFSTSISTDDNRINTFTIMVDSSRIFEYKIVNGNDVSIYVIGYWYTR